MVAVTLAHRGASLGVCRHLLRRCFLPRWLVIALVHTYVCVRARVHVGLCLCVRTRARVCVRMGCGASSAVPPEQNAAAPPAEGRSGAKDDLRSCWEAVAGDGAGATLSERQVRGVLEELGKRLSDDEFAAAFKAMDSNGTGAYTAAFALPPVFLL